MRPAGETSLAGAGGSPEKHRLVLVRERPDDLDDSLHRGTDDGEVLARRGALDARDGQSAQIGSRDGGEEQQRLSAGLPDERSAGRGATSHLHDDHSVHAVARRADRDAERVGRVPLDSLHGGRVGLLRNGCAAGGQHHCSESDVDGGCGLVTPDPLPCCGGRDVNRVTDLERANGPVGDDVHRYEAAITIVRPVMKDRSKSSRILVERGAGDTESNNLDGSAERELRGLLKSFHACELLDQLRKQTFHVRLPKKKHPLLRHA